MRHSHEVMAIEQIEIDASQTNEIQDLPGVHISKIPVYDDSRGSLHEIWRQDEIPEGFVPMMACASWTHAGGKRGPHEHEKQDDYFIFAGPSDFQIALWDARSGAAESDRVWLLSAGESNPIQLHVPRGVVHGYRNIGRVSGLVLTVASELFKGQGRVEPVDEIRHEQNPDSPYKFPNL